MWAVLREDLDGVKSKMTYKSVLQSWPISLTSLAKGSFPDQKVRALLVFPYLPERHCSWTIPMLSFTAPAVAGADLRAFFVARVCFGTGPPVDLRELL